MSVLVVTSPETNAGKTAAIIAIGQRLRQLGKRIDYRRLPGPGAVGDARFVLKALRLAAAVETLAPSAERVDASLATDADVLLVEAGDVRAAAETIQATDGVALIVAPYVVEGLTERILELARAIGIPAASAIINLVPDKGRREVELKVVPALRETGLSVLGIVPQDRILLGMTAGDLARALDAKVLCAVDQLGLPVESVMISA